MSHHFDSQEGSILYNNYNNHLPPRQERKWEAPQLRLLPTTNTHLLLLAGVFKSRQLRRQPSSNSRTNWMDSICLSDRLEVNEYLIATGPNEGV